MAMTDKEYYGEVSTDNSLIREMLNLIPQEKYEDPSLCWLDPACGYGNFMKVLSERLFHSLETIFPNAAARRRHIYENMLFMVEINEKRISYLEQAFPGAHITCQDFLDYKGEFDIIIGNPPFNCQGLKKVPTNTTRSKKTDGKTIWPAFVRHAVSLLREGGLLSMITPSIWMKPDNAGIYDLLTGKTCQLKKIRCFTNTETNRLFHGHAQTPTCYFLAKKAASEMSISLYERNVKRYIPYLMLTDEQPLPVFGASVFAKLQPYMIKVGSPIFIKTSMPPKHTFLRAERCVDASYCNIRTCILAQKTPLLVHEYSDYPLAFYGQPKLILAHKMYGFPFYDASGNYGISRRDSYVMVGKSREEFKKWHAFLSTRFALYLFEGTRYRMKYLEKYVFELIPDILKLDDFPKIINDNTIADYFQLTDIERKAIERLHTKNYTFFPFDVLKGTP